MFSKRIITDESEFATLHEEWNALLNESISPSIFLTWEWLFTWWQYFKTNNKLFIIEVRNEYQKLIGIGPFFIKKNHFNIRSLHFLGSDDCVASDMLDVIVAIPNATATCKEIYTFLHHNQKYWDILFLTDIEESSISHDMFNIIAREFKYHCQKKVKEICPIIELPENYDYFLSNLSSRTRRNIRNYQRRLLDQYNVSYKKINGTFNAHHLIETLHTLHLKRRARLSKYSSLQHALYRTFQFEVVKKMSNSGAVLFYVLNQKQKPIAIFFFLNFKNQLFLYQGGFDQCNIPQHISIMLVLMTFCIQDAIQNGYKKIHLLRGETSFKNKLSHNNLVTYRYMLGKSYKYHLFFLQLKTIEGIKNLLKRLLPEQYWDILKKRLKRFGSS